MVSYDLCQEGLDCGVMKAPTVVLSVHESGKEETSRYATLEWLREEYCG